PGVQRMAARLEGLRPEVMSRYMEIAGIVWERAQEQVSAETMQAGFNPPSTPPAASYQPQPPAYQHSHPPMGPHTHSIGDYRGR
ncbi:MAG: hypothetical protein ACR2NP_12560, partial [Pirellulaceae bacterium]